MFVIGFVNYTVSQSSDKKAAAKPRRPVGSDALAELFSLKNVAAVALRHLAIAELLLVNHYFKELLEEDNRAAELDELPNDIPFPTNKAIETAVRSMYSAMREFNILLTRCFLDWQASLRLNSALANKLLKELKSSLLRKCPLPWYIRGYRVAKTSVYSMATYYTAEFIVTCGYEWYDALQELQRTAGKASSKIVKHCLARCVLHAGRGTVLLGAYSLGYGIGASSPVHRTTVAFICSQITVFFAGTYCSFYINALCPRGRPPGEGGTLQPPPAPAPPNGGVVPALIEEVLEQAVPEQQEEAPVAPPEAAFGDEPIVPRLPEPQQRRPLGGVGGLPQRRQRRPLSSGGPTTPSSSREPTMQLETQGGLEEPTTPPNERNRSI